MMGTSTGTSTTTTTTQHAITMFRTAMLYAIQHVSADDAYHHARNLAHAIRQATPQPPSPPVQRRIVKFTNPVDDAERHDRMIVIENRGDRLLVESIVYCTDWNIRPQMVYPVSDLVDTTRTPKD